MYTYLCIYICMYMNEFWGARDACILVINIAYVRETTLCALLFFDLYIWLSPLKINTTQKSTRPKTPFFSGQIQLKPKYQFEFVPRDTDSEFLDCVDFEKVSRKTFRVWTVFRIFLFIDSCIYLHTHSWGKNTCALAVLSPKSVILMW